MKLRRLKILKFRNVLPGTELEFNDGYNVLLGQNGSGKTTLLRLITSVLRGDFVWLEKEPFALEADLELGLGKVALVIAHKRGEREEQQLDAVPWELRAFIPTNEPWSTTIDLRVITKEGDSWQLHAEDGPIKVLLPGLPEKTMAFDARVLRVALFLCSAAFFLTTFAAHDKLASNATSFINFLDESLSLRDAYRFDESLELFSAITARCSALGKDEFGDIAGRIRTRSERSEDPLSAYVPPSLVPPQIIGLNALKNPNFDSPADALILKHDQAPFLAKVMQLLGYVGAEIKLEFLGKEVTDDKKTLEYGNLRFFFHRRDGWIGNQDLLSYGQKRLLTFFYYVACNPHVVVADELVNGLHHAWIEECISAMGDRQVFVTSQNPILLDHLGFNSADQVRRTFITCQAKPEGVRDRLTWANMTKKNADAFYRAYKVGAQHVGEILRTKGFW